MGSDAISPARTSPAGAGRQKLVCPLEIKDCSIWLVVILLVLLAGIAVCVAFVLWLAYG